jgi:hypothetical protein
LYFASNAFAQQVPVGPLATDKSQYDLFSPTPNEFMRELSPDRPDATESPLTVDAGHFVIEASIFDWRRNDGSQTHTLMSTNFKIGLSNNTDLQFVFDTYSWEDPKVGNDVEGFGDVQLRLKYNLWGNDGGDSALALFPFVKIPTSAQFSNDEWEGGLIIPYATELSGGLGLGLMAEFDVVYDAVGKDHDFEFLHSAVLGFDLSERFGSFVEYVGIEGGSSYKAFGAGGFTYSVHDDLVLDLGTQVGLNDAAEDFGLFFGFTRRW